APPISVPGTRFASLEERLMPDPQQPIGLRVADADGEPLAGEGVEAGAASEGVEVGSLIEISTGLIWDRNRKRVRNGTPVDFVIAWENDPSAPEVVTVGTQHGSAKRE